MPAKPATSSIRIVLRGNLADVASRWAQPSPTPIHSWRRWGDRVLYFILVATLWCVATWLFGHPKPWHLEVLPWLAGASMGLAWWLCKTTSLARLRVPSALAGLGHALVLLLATVP